jgi:hypothetical protein
MFISSAVVNVDRNGAKNENITGLNETREIMHL